MLVKANPVRDAAKPLKLAYNGFLVAYTKSICKENKKKESYKVRPELEWKQQYSSLCAQEDLLECKQQPKDFSLSDVRLAKQTNKHIHPGVEKAGAEITKTCKRKAK